MDAVGPAIEPGDRRFDGLRAEASEAVAYSANTLRAKSERYREAYAESLHRWKALRDEPEPSEGDVEALSTELGLAPGRARQAGARAADPRADLAVPRTG